MCKAEFKEFFDKRVDYILTNFLQKDKEYIDYTEQVKQILEKIKSVVPNEHLYFFEQCLEVLKSKLDCVENIIADMLYVKGLKEGTTLRNILKLDPNVESKKLISERYKEYIEHFITIRVNEVGFNAMNDTQTHKDLGKKILDLQGTILKILSEDDKRLFHQHEEARAYKDSIVHEALYKQGFEDGQNVVELFLK